VPLCLKFYTVLPNTTHYLLVQYWWKLYPLVSWKSHFLPPHEGIFSKLILDATNFMLQSKWTSVREISGNFVFLLKFVDLKESLEEKKLFCQLFFLLEKLKSSPEYSNHFATRTLTSLQIPTLSHFLTMTIDHLSFYSDMRYRICLNCPFSLPFWTISLQ